MENFKALIVNELAKGRNVIFVPHYDSELSDDFITYLWANFFVSTQGKGMYFHIDIPLSIDERIKEMTYQQLEKGFLTDGDLIGSDTICDFQDYKGWILDYDNQTGATCFNDPKSLISLYCSPSFEEDWGQIGFNFSSEYEFSNGDNWLSIFEIDVRNLYGDKKAQYKVWKAKVMQAIDEVEKHVDNYKEMCLKVSVSNAINSLITTDEQYKIHIYQSDTRQKLDALEGQLVEVLKEIKKLK
jgi:hypothetical protein